VPAAPDDPDLTGQTLLDKLRVVRRIGAGAHGSVYEVEHLLTHHRRALKVLRADRVGSAEAVARLVREASAAGRVRSPFLVETFDVGKLEDGSPYVLMELLHAQTLRSLLDTHGKLEPAYAMELAAQICEGLAAVHGAGLVHRDLKPENLAVFTDAGGRQRIKILDFGVVRFEHAEEDGLGVLTAPGSIAGTPAYMAPEVLEGSPAIAVSDVYAVGIVLYELLGGCRPYDASNVPALLRKIHRGTPAPLTELRSDLDPEVVELVARAMHRDPAARFPSAAALRDALLPRKGPELPRAFGPGPVLGGRYEVLRCLKVGGMGAVYEARHLATDRRRALKVMLPGLFTDARLRERFQLEARVGAAIESEHVVEVLETGVDEDSGAPYLVMELLKGRELGALLGSDGPRPKGEAITLLSQVAAVLDKTHEAGIVHRDLKPENLFLTYRDDGTPRIKVLDFGIAKVLADQRSPATLTTTGLGTPLYMAPEQIAPDAPVTGSADRYALAHVAYALLVGSPYFTEEAQAGLYTLIARTGEGPRDPATRRSARSGKVLPPAFDAWFARAAALRAEERFSSARAMIDALADVLGEPRPEIRAVPHRLEDRPVDASAKTGQAMARSSPGVPARPRSWTPAALLLAAVTVGTIAVSVVRLSGSDSHPSPATAPSRALPSVENVASDSSARPFAPPPIASSSAAPVASALASAPAAKDLTVPVASGKPTAGAIERKKLPPGAPRPAAVEPTAEAPRAPVPAKPPRQLDDGIF
jgi:eukaryotic-like serine/threonine-protein kinase